MRLFFEKQFDHQIDLFEAQIQNIKDKSELETCIFIKMIQEIRGITEKYKNKFRNTLLDMEEYRIEPLRTSFFKWDDDKKGDK